MPNSLLFVMLVGLGLTVWFLLESNLKIRERRLQVAKNLTEIETVLALEQEQKQRHLAALGRKDNPWYLEKEARQRFNLRKPGEQVLVIVGEKPASESASLSLSPSAQTWWQKIAQWFGF